MLNTSPSLNNAPLPSYVLDAIGQNQCAVFGDPSARFLLLSGIVPDKRDSAPPDQAHEVFEIATRHLAEAGMDWSHVARTWFYLDGILDWYDAFNAVRSSFFREHGISLDTPPASTGVGAAARGGPAVECALLAVLPHTDAVRVNPVDSPRQCPAPRYGSAFSRAVAINGPGYRWLTVSGTASVGLEGETLHLDDLEAQVHETLGAVGALLDRAGLGWEAARRSVLYLKPGQDPARLRAILRGTPCGLADLEPVRCDICRDDLLFELELDALQVD